MENQLKSKEIMDSGGGSVGKGDDFDSIFDALLKGFDFAVSEGIGYVGRNSVFVQKLCICIYICTLVGLESCK